MGGRIKWIFLSGLLLVALILRLRGISNPLLDDQAWRQADTACMATHMMGHLLDFPEVFLPKLNYDGVVPQNVELEFPFLPYLMAWTWTMVGWSDFWGRLWAIGLSLITVVGVYDLGRNMFSQRAGLLAAGIYAVMPLSVYYGRVVMPEPMAQAWSIWALAMIWRWRYLGDEKGVWKAALLMAGAVLAKLPQAMIFPVAIVIGFYPLKYHKLKKLLQYCAIVIIPSIVYYLWVHLNAVSSGKFVSGIMTNQVMNSSDVQWITLLGNMYKGFTGVVLLLACVGMVRLSFLKSPIRRALIVWTVICTLYVGVVCVRISLDYYLVPVLPILALLSAYALEGIPSTTGTVLGIIILLLVSTVSYGVLTPKYFWNPEYLNQALWIREHAEPDSILILSDSPPMTFYYGEKVGFRLTGVLDDVDAMNSLEQLPGNYLVQLPDTQQRESFWKMVEKRYPEIGPGIYNLNLKQ